MASIDFDPEVSRPGMKPARLLTPAELHWCVGTSIGIVRGTHQPPAIWAQHSWDVNGRSPWIAASQTIQYMELVEAQILHHWQDVPAPQDGRMLARMRLQSQLDTCEMTWTDTIEPLLNLPQWEHWHRVIVWRFTKDRLPGIKRGIHQFGNAKRQYLTPVVCEVVPQHLRQAYTAELINRLPACECHSANHKCHRWLWEYGLQKWSLDWYAELLAVGVTQPLEPLIATYRLDATSRTRTLVSWGMHLQWWWDDVCARSQLTDQSTHAVRLVAKMIDEHDADIVDAGALLWGMHAVPPCPNGAECTVCVAHKAKGCYQHPRDELFSSRTLTADEVMQRFQLAATKAALTDEQLLRLMYGLAYASSASQVAEPTYFDAHAFLCEQQSSMAYGSQMHNVALRLLRAPTQLARAFKVLDISLRSSQDSTPRLPQSVLLLVFSFVGWSFDHIAVEPRHAAMALDVAQSSGDAW